MKLLGPLKLIKSYKAIHRSAVFISLVYGLIYYTSAGFLTFGKVARFNTVILTNWQALLWQSRGPFQWEAVALIALPIGVTVLISLPNLILMMLLSFLVYGNVALVLIGIYHPTVCRISGKGSRVLSMVPALFTGFGCCAPTVIIMWVGLVGSVSSSVLIFARWLLPIGMVLLVWGFIRGYKALSLNV